MAGVYFTEPNIPVPKALKIWSGLRMGSKLKLGPLLTCLKAVNCTVKNTVLFPKVPESKVDTELPTVPNTVKMLSWALNCLPLITKGVQEPTLIGFPGWPLLFLELKERIFNL